MVYGPKAGLGTWLTIGVTAASLGLPAAIVLAGPSLSQPSPPLATTPGAPIAPGPPGRLDAQLTNLPIVVTDFPDAPSLAAASEYAHLRVQPWTDVWTMFSDTWSSLVVDGSAAAAVSQLGDYLVSLQSGSDYYIDLGPQVQSYAAAALPGLVSDPRNADRLSNAAVALFDMGVSWDQGFAARSDYGVEYAYGTFLEARAMALLHESSIAFPANKVVVLNLAYLTSLIPGGCTPNIGNLQAALGLALASLAMAPDDTVARLLASSLQVRDTSKFANVLLPGRSDQPPSLTAALATVDPLVGINVTAQLGYAAKGDAYLAAASGVSGQAPYQARHYADLARIGYEKALSAINDPGLWAGEAASLNILDNTSAALAAQRTAVSLAPDSAELLIGLAFAEERVGDFQGMRTAAQKALELSVTGINPLFRESRLVSSSPGTPILGDRGYLGYSIGSDRPRLPVYNVEQGCGAGGFVTTDDAIPALDYHDFDGAARYLPLPDAAVITAIAASLVLSDPSTAEADVNRWKDLAGSNATAGMDQLWLDRVAQIDGVDLQAVHLVTDGSVRQGTDPARAATFAEAYLRHAGNAAKQATLFARAAAVCHLEVIGQGPFGAIAEADRSPARVCEGESAYHAGDYASASAAFEASYRDSQSADVGTEAAIAIWKAGRPEEAHQLLLQILSGPGVNDTTFLGTQEILGELLLDLGHPSEAIDHLEVAVLAAQSLQHSSGGADFTSNLRLAAEHAYNNHGIALLGRAQPSPGAVPDCGAKQDVCKQARDNFAAALSMDPSNPYYLQNAAWSDRLLNRLSASRAELAAAVAADPSNFPVLNDLGVMAASEGDLTTAQQAFQSSLRARPDYDLAAWNLGVVDMQLGALNIAAGQAYLALASKENAQLRGSRPEYQVDNRIYRATFGQALQPLQSAGTIHGYSTAAVGTGAVAAVSAFGDVVGVQFRSWLAKMLQALGRPLLARIVQPLRRLRFPQRLPAPVRTWFLTALVLGAGTVWTVLSRQGVAGGAELALAALAVGIAVMVHECGHLIAACVCKIKIEPAPSPLGIAMSLLLIPLHVSSGPYAGHRLVSRKGIQRAKWVYLAGPVANLLVAGLAYGLYVVRPFPFLLLLTGVQLAAAGFSLMPFEPLDGAALGKSRTDHATAFSFLAALLALVAGAGGAAIAFGLF
jgi:tetratricopeptide (TPR) repeat protein